MADIIQSNKDLADFLDLLAEYYSLDYALTKDKTSTQRKNTFANAATQIRDYPHPILSGAQARNELSRIGPSTVTEIDSFLTSRTSTRLQELEARFTEAKHIINYFQTFHGIGPVNAMKYYQQGFRTWEDLWLKAPISDATRMSIYWQNHTSVRIERAEMDLIKAKLSSIIDLYGIKWVIAGSYRRGEPSSGDIDILVESRPDLNMDGMAYLFRDLIPSIDINGVNTPCILAKGEVSMFGILRLDDQHKAHRFDVKFIAPVSYPYALLHFTGSWQFNVLIRRRAQELGLSLNEYTLFAKQEVRPGEYMYSIYPAQSEADIFQILGLQYLPPEARVPTLTHLPVGPQKVVHPITITAGKLTPAQLMKMI